MPQTENQIQKTIAAVLAVTALFLSIPSTAGTPDKDAAAVRSIFADKPAQAVRSSGMDSSALNKPAEPVQSVPTAPSVVVPTQVQIDPPVRQQPMPVIATRKFEIKLDDETLSLALRRWATEHNYQLVWDAGKDFPVKSTVYSATDIVSAVEQVMADTERSSFPMHACSYRNSVIRVLHVSQQCERR